MTSSLVYEIPAQLRKAAQRLRGLARNHFLALSPSEVELLRKVSETLDAIAAGHDVLVKTSNLGEPKP